LGSVGLQDGPAGLDWVGQVEQRNPVLGFIAPPELAGPAFRRNRDRLVTAHDVYRTVSQLLRPRVEMVPAEHPVWAYDLLHDAVPVDRTCAAALVPPDYCVCSHEHTGLDGGPSPDAHRFATDYARALTRAGTGNRRWPTCSALQPSPRGMCGHEDPVRRDSCCFKGENPSLLAAFQHAKQHANSPSIKAH